MSSVQESKQVEDMKAIEYILWEATQIPLENLFPTCTLKNSKQNFESKTQVVNGKNWSISYSSKESKLKDGVSVQKAKH